MKPVWSKDHFDLMAYTLVGWESSVDPRYTDFSETEFSALRPTIPRSVK